MTKQLRVQRTYPAALRVGLTLCFLAGGLLLGWGKMAPVPAIVFAAGINTMLIQRLPANSWSRMIRNAFFFFFLAEVACFMGLYLFAQEFFLLLHDGLHVASLFCLFGFAASFLTPNPLVRLCPAQDHGCVDCEREPEACCLRTGIGAFNLGGIILSATVILLWWIHQNEPFLGTPEGITESSRVLTLLILPSVALSVFFFIFLRVEIFGKRTGTGDRDRMLAASAMLSYSIFQLLIFLLVPALALPVEEYLEFFPMVPVFYFALNRGGMRDRNQRANGSTDGERSASCSPATAMTG